MHTLPFCLQTGRRVSAFPRIRGGGREGPGVEGWRGKGEEVSLFMWMRVCACVLATGGDGRAGLLASGTCLSV